MGLRFILSYMKKLRKSVWFCVFIKFCGVICELLLPALLEKIIDDVVPTGDIGQVFFWGGLMILMAAGTAGFNIWANRMAVSNAQQVAFDIRQDLFARTSNLSGHQFDTYGLPSLTSRMTSDSYNVQQFAQSVQVMFVRVPLLMIGGVIMMIMQDPVLAMILVGIIIPLFLLIYGISRKGIPLFDKVQDSLDVVVRVMRENISGIRVVKALTKSSYEKKRFDEANEDMFHRNVTASTTMALPGPIMNICLNAGLAVVVFVGAKRVNAGIILPGVILASLTYFNQILHTVMGLNRLFMMTSKASASAGRIAEVVLTPEEQQIFSPEEVPAPAGDEFIRVEHVDFRYNAGSEGLTLENMDFAIREGESLGIIGPTGSGKSTLVQLLMRFYDVEKGGIFIDGKNVLCYDKDELRRMFGVVFQNDIIFQDTLRDNIRFGREISEEELQAAVEDAMASSFVYDLKGGLDFQAEIKGANMSGGQKQRILVTRALAGKPRILILDDSSSALDYRTDASLRHNISEHYAGVTTIMIAQRVSSVKGLSHILVLDEGKAIGYGTHEELMENCPYYRNIANAQMGALE